MAGHGVLLEDATKSKEKLMIPVSVMRPTALAYRYLQTYAPTNIIIARVRRTGASTRVACGLLALSTIFAISANVLADAADTGGPSWLNLGVLLFSWNAIKIAWTAAICPVWSFTRSRHCTGEGEA